MLDLPTANAPMNFAADPEHEMLRDSIKRFFAEELPETAIRRMDRERKIGPSVWRRVAELGWTALSTPTQFGGAGGDVMTTVVLIEEVSKRFGSLSNDLVVLAMAARALREHGSPAQQRDYLPKLAAGTLKLAFGITEPGGGTDALALRTKAELVDGAWRLNGRKLFTTLGDEADAIFVLCRTDPPEGGKRARGLSWIIMPRHQNGVEIRRLQLMAHRAACTCETFIDDAIAPADALLGARGRGWYQLLATLDEERILAAACYVGIIDGVLEQTVQYAKDRTAYGRPIGGFQAVQHPIAEMATDLAHARLMTMKAAWMLSRGLECSQEALMAKLFATEAAIRATDKGLRVLGGYGLVEESPMERLFRDARLGPFSPISNEMAKNVIAERLGLPRSY